jgi:hypothetical protein
MTSVLRRLHLLPLALVTALALPSGAAADTEAIIRDCNLDGTLNGTYTKQELREARDNLPADVREYSDCSDVIAAAIASGTSGGEGTKAGAASKGDPDAREDAARQNDRDELARLTGDDRDEPGAISVGGREVSPGSNGLFEAADASNELPLPLLLALIGLGLLALAAGFMALRSRIPALGRIPLPSIARRQGPRR